MNSQDDFLNPQGRLSANWTEDDWNSFYEDLRRKEKAVQDQELLEIMQRNAADRGSMETPRDAAQKKIQMMAQELGVSPEEAVQLLFANRGAARGALGAADELAKIKELMGQRKFGLPTGNTVG